MAFLENATLLNIKYFFGSLHSQLKPDRDLSWPEGKILKCLKIKAWQMCESGLKSLQNGLKINESVEIWT